MSGLRNRRILVVLAVVVLAVAAAALFFAVRGETESAEPAEPQPAEPAPEQEEETTPPEEATFVFAMPAVVTDLDGPNLYQGDQSRRQGYELGSNLVRYSATELEGLGCDELATAAHLSSDLAESWGWTDERDAIFFRLKSGVMSDWGNELTAEDVKWSIDRALALSPIARFFYYTAARFEEEDPVQIIDDRTVHIRLAEATNLDIVLHTSFLLQIYDSTEARRHVTEDDPWAHEFLAKNSATFGPWTVREADIDPGRQVIFRPNPNYQGERGNITQLVHRAVPESSTRLQLLKAGEVDLINRLSYDEVADLDAAQATEPVEPRICVSPQRDIMIPNHEFEPFSDKRVRQAISMALDRDELVAAGYQGFARPAESGMSLSYDYPRASNETLRANQERARELLAEAGYPEGFTFTLSVSPNRPGGYAPSLAVLIGDQLARVGINVDIRIVAGAADYTTIFGEGNYEALIWDMGPVVGEPAYELFLHNPCDGFQNSHRYCNPRYDQLAEAVTVTPPGADRDGFLNQVDELILDDIPLIFIAEVSYIMGWRKGISGFQNHPHGELFAVDLVKDE